MAPPKVENVFRSLDPGSMGEGECYFRPGPAQDSAVGAPHEGFDLYTSFIARDFAKLFPAKPVAYCEGFRKGEQFDVNRPSGKGDFLGSARRVMKKYERHIFAANQGRIPRMVYEIHGKSDRGHPHTEIALIGGEQRCGWGDEIRRQVKTLWESKTGKQVLVYGLDEKARLGHTGYQEEGLAGIHGWCGVNIELSREIRDLWNSTNNEKEELAAQRVGILNALGGLFVFAEQKVKEGRPNFFAGPLREATATSEKSSRGCGCNLGARP